MQSSTPGEVPATSGIISCATASPVVVLVFTVLATISATGILCSAIMTDDWEQLEWDHQKLVQILGPGTHVTMHDRVVRVEMPGLGE